MSKQLKRLLILLWSITIIGMIALRCYKNPVKAFKSVRGIFVFRKKMNRFNKLPKYYYANKRYYMTMNIPGFPSNAFSQFIRDELNHILPFNPNDHHLQMAVFSVTNRCPLRCLHCYEWERLNGTDYLSLDQLIQIQQKLEAYGLRQIQYTGGEPMMRINDLNELIKSTLPTTDTWIFSSGFNFTPENTQSLKKAGLTGVILSLDHWNEPDHNQFRQSDQAFKWVTSAAENIVKADLALSLSLCPSREFVTRENLTKYLHFAQKLKAGFIQILEPRAAGRFKNQDIELKADHLRVIGEFTLDVNNNQKYRNYPTILFPGYHQREFGCFGAGRRFLYIDSKGDLNACPFCQESFGNTVENDLNPLIEQLKSRGCPKFGKALTVLN